MSYTARVSPDHLAAAATRPNELQVGVTHGRLMWPGASRKIQPGRHEGKSATSDGRALGLRPATRSLPICRTCGTQIPPQQAGLRGCLNCPDSGPYSGPGGRQWTSLDELGGTHRNTLCLQEAGLWGIGTEPGFALGQRALLVQTQEGNVLWDCTPLLDDAIIDAVCRLGGVAAIAISHPHYYSTMVEWSRIFGDAPIYLPASHRRSTAFPDAAIHFWEGETINLGAEVTLIRTGGHYEGSQVLHWASGADGRGALLSGDLPYVVSGHRWAGEGGDSANPHAHGSEDMRCVIDALKPYPYARIYGAQWQAIVTAAGCSATSRAAGVCPGTMGADGLLWDRMLTAPRTWPEYIRYF